MSNHSLIEATVWHKKKKIVTQVHNSFLGAVNTYEGIYLEQQISNIWTSGSLYISENYCSSQGLLCSKVIYTNINHIEN